jgi:hypothetical protein
VAENIKVSMTAVIPTAQYANLQPTVEVEGATFEEARDIALKQIQSVSAMVSDKPLQVNFADAPTVAVAATKPLPQIDAFTGGSLGYEDATHKYEDGYISGSAFSHKFIAPFNRQAISYAFANKHKVDQEAILEMWDKNAEASTSLGTSIHAALELYGKFHTLSMATKGTTESCLHKNPLLANIVKVFYKGREKEKAVYEALVVNREQKLCGFIDRLLIVDEVKKICRVQDYKTNPDIHKKKSILAPFKGVIDGTELGAYWLQLSFYAYILQKAGWTVEGLDIFNFVTTEQDNGSLVIEMETHTHDVIDITQGLK